jgi:GTP-binding protein
VKFVDEAFITVRSGDGGRGCTSFRRERFVAKGGPDGGDGGDGGNVILRADPGRRTLYDYRRQKLHRAENGKPGQGRQKHGRNGRDCILPMPPGTIVSNADTDEIIIDLTQAGKDYVIARGGMGGRGNKRFATSTNRAPRYSQPGTPGIELNLKLELKLLADVGLVGLPNAGKSTLISSISAARPKIADYPFTTLTPVLGMVEPDFGEPFAVADIPGLIEGAHEGTGLGISFLKHIERTGILVHMIDASEIDPDLPLACFELVNNELCRYSRTLAEKDQIIVLNKIDLPHAEEKAEAFCNAADGTRKIFILSAATGRGIKELVTFLASRLAES